MHHQPWDSCLKEGKCVNLSPAGRWAPQATCCTHGTVLPLFTIHLSPSQDFCRYLRRNFRLSREGGCSCSLSAGGESLRKHWALPLTQPVVSEALPAVVHPHEDNGSLSWHTGTHGAALSGTKNSPFHALHWELGGSIMEVTRLKKMGRNGNIPPGFVVDAKGP